MCISKMTDAKYEAVKEKEIENGIPILIEESVKVSPRNKALAVRVAVIVTIVTFGLAISYLIDYSNENNLFTRTIHNSISFLESAPVSWAYNNQPMKIDGVLILSAPFSRTSLLTSYISSAGYRTSSSNEMEPSMVIPYDKTKITSNNKLLEIMEPLQRLDSFHENKVLLANQGMKWNSSHVYKYNSTLVKERIYKDNFLRKSNVLRFLDGWEEEKDRPWIWNDFQLCLTLPAWLDVLMKSSSAQPQHPRKIAAIFTYRHPLEMAQAINTKFPSIPLVKALRLWLDYNYKCLSNIVNESHRICPIYTSNDDVVNDAKNQINSMLTELDDKCEIAPGRPGRLGNKSARHDWKNMQRYEEEQRAIGKHKHNGLKSDEVVLDALGINDFKMDCESFHEIGRYKLDKAPEYEWGDEALTEAMNELDHLDEISNPDEQSTFVAERNRLQGGLRAEIIKWMGEDVSDAIDQLFHLEGNEKQFVTRESTVIKTERTRFMTNMRTEIALAFSEAMKVYCDLETGDALDKKYRWPIYNLS